MFALLILPILVSGFIALTLNPYERLKLHRYDGQLLYLKAAKKGFIFFLWTVVLCLVFKDQHQFSIGINEYQMKFETFELPLVTWFADTISKSSNLVKPTTDTLEATWLITISILTVLLSFAWQYLHLLKIRLLNSVANRSFFNHNNDIIRIHMLGEILKDSPIDYIFYESSVKRRAIMITLKSRKVYVGMVNKLGEPNESREPNQEISLVTAMSGFRDKDTLAITFTNNYSQPGVVAEEQIQILRLDEIESVCWYHEATFTAVNTNLTPAPAPAPAPAPSPQEAA